MSFVPYAFSFFPIGLQAVGGQYSDYVTIDFARLLAREIGGFQPPPRAAVDEEKRKRRESRKGRKGRRWGGRPQR